MNIKGMKEFQKINKNKAAAKVLSTTINDNCKGGIDRFGFFRYAEALYTVLANSSPPVCVGLYAKWGSGKSFMIFLLKKNFDPDVVEDPRTHELYQYYEDEYQNLKGSANCEEAQDFLENPFMVRLRLIHKCVSRPIVESYGLLIFISVLMEFIKERFMATASFCNKFYQVSWHFRSKLMIYVAKDIVSVFHQLIGL